MNEIERNSDIRESQETASNQDRKIAKTNISDQIRLSTIDFDLDYQLHTLSDVSVSPSLIEIYHRIEHAYHIRRLREQTENTDR